MALISTLKDNFNDNSQGSVWGNSYATNGATKAETGGVARFSCVTSATSAYAAYSSTATYDLTSSSASIQVKRMVSTDTNAQFFFKLSLSATSTIEFIQEAGTIYTKITTGGVSDTYDSSTYDIDTYRWLRIREQGGYIYWEYSSEGLNWFTLTRQANPFAVSALYVEFGAGTYQSESSPGYAEVDNFNYLPSGISASPKQFIYKLFNNGEYIGTIPDVVSKFQYSQNINTSGSQLEIEIGRTFDGMGPIIDADFLVDESGNFVVDENGDNILGSKNYTFDTVMTDLGAEVQVWMYDDAYVDGLRVFDGIITAWKADYTGNTTAVTVLSNGVELDNYVLYTGVVTNVEQNEYDGEEDFGYKGTGGKPTAVAQTFQVTADTSIATIGVYLREGNTVKDKTIKVSLVAGTPSSPGAELAAVTKKIENTSFVWTEFTFPTPVEVTASTDYHVILTNNNAAPSYTGYPFVTRSKSSSVYASGNLFTYSGSTWTSTTRDLCFIVSSGTGETSVAFNSREPGEIVRSIMDNFNQQGGIVSYDINSIGDTGRVVSYTFVLNTVFEALQKSIELAPANWYWYVDVGSNLLTFQSQGSTADHTFILGRHIANLELERRIETVRNVVYFSGGEVAGENVFRLLTNQSSIDNYGVWLEKMSDNRVTNSETADILAQGALDQNAEPSYRTTLVIPCSVYDIETIKLGDMVGFGNFNELINDLLLQVVSINREPEQVTIGLDTLPPIQSQRIEDIKRNLEKQETINNPDSPN